MSKKWIILLVIVAVLVGVRIALPFIVKNQINKVMSDMGDYQGKVVDVDLALIRGAYVIDSLVIEKTIGDIRKPFLNVPRIDLSIEWSALFNGALVAEVVVDRPQLNLVTGKNEEQSQYGKDVHWVDQFKKLLPIKINRFAIKNGSLAYYDPTQEPQLDFDLADVNFEATNLSNVVDQQDTLPSSLKGDATALDGVLEISGGANVLKKVPDFDANLKFENIDLTQLNPFSKSYADFDFHSGTLNFYFEMAMYEGAYKGYAKPLFDNVKITGNGRDTDKGFFNRLWQGTVSVVFEAFENQPEEQTGTQVPFSGHLDDTDIGLWPTIKYMFSNAFIEALSKELDYNVELKNVGTSRMPNPSEMKDSSTDQSKDEP